jgi:hypothetical protein
MSRLLSPRRNRLSLTASGMREYDSRSQIQPVETPKRVPEYGDLRRFAAAQRRRTAASNETNIQARIELERKRAFAFSVAHNKFRPLVIRLAAEHMDATKVVALELVQPRSKCVSTFGDRVSNQFLGRIGPSKQLYGDAHRPWRKACEDARAVGGMETPKAARKQGDTPRIAVQ